MEERVRYDGKRKTAAPARWASERGSRGATPEGLRRREDDGASGAGGVGWGVPREPLCERRPGYNGATPPAHFHPEEKERKKKKLLRRKIIPSITERQAEKCLKCFSFSCPFFFSSQGSGLLFTVSRVKWVFEVAGRRRRAARGGEIKERQYVRKRIYC